jgi:polyphosphate kinase 2 (PPK2 family)
MLEMLDLSRSLNKLEYHTVVDPLTMRLGELQRETRAAGIPTILVFEGWNAAGKGRCIGALLQPLDPRGYRVHTFKEPSEDEALRPFLWRYWIRLPAKGEIAIFERCWYTRVVGDRVEHRLPRKVWQAAYGTINDFEHTLVEGGAVLVKLWLHISREEQARRFQKLERDPAESWKVTREDWREQEHYDRYLHAVEEMLERTGTAWAPWTVVEAEDRRFAVAKVFETLAAAWEEALRRTQTPAAPRPAAPIRERTRKSPILSRVDLGKALTREVYAKKIRPLQKRLRTLEHLLYATRLPVVVVFEGWDASGKGGAIRRLTADLDPRGFEVIPISAPNEVERSHHYLWRFWRHVPKAGHLAIFDRSWYGRVLVERVEGFCQVEEWRRAYREINEFEATLSAEGTVLIKLWLHISPEAQLARFRKRQSIGYKKWKITGEDWRNRKKRPRYEEAAAEMLERTSTSFAPWTIVPADDKYYARVKVLETVIRTLERALERRKRKRRG